MSKKSKQYYWFGCEKCQYIPPKNNNMSNENWAVYDSAPCPKCGEKMILHIGEPPKEQEKK